MIDSSNSKFQMVSGANCPSRGCKNCPMFGVGLNPEFQKKEERRTTKLAKKKMQKEMESKNKRAEL